MVERMISPWRVDVRVPPLLLIAADTRLAENRHELEKVSTCYWGISLSSNNRDIDRGQQLQMPILFM